MQILVTGASGFVGTALMQQLQNAQQHHAIASQTRLDADTDWSAELRDIQIIIHCAARVHVMRDKSVDPLAAFRTVNVHGTLRLAEQAASAGVKRFIFISSIKVNGEETQPNNPFSADDPPNPQDAYGISKREAEDGLREIAQTTGMEVTIIRPPLVYGAGVKGNFALLIRLVRLGIPIPFGSIRNKRSLVSRDNLLDLITVCCTHPAAKNQTFLVSDGIDISTPMLIRSIAAAMEKRARLVAIPSKLLTALGYCLGKPDVVRRLVGSLEINIDKTSSLLGWRPKHRLPETLSWLTKANRQTADKY